MNVAWASVCQSAESPTAAPDKIHIQTEKRTSKAFVVVCYAKSNKTVDIIHVQNQLPTNKHSSQRTRTRRSKMYQNERENITSMTTSTTAAKYEKRKIKNG